MSKVTVGVTYGDFSAPAGTTVANVVITIKDVAQGITVSQTVGVGTMSVSFADVVVGTYTMTAQAVDEAGVSVGPAATGSFVVAAPATVIVQIPVAVTAVVA